MGYSHAYPWEHRREETGQGTFESRFLHLNIQDIYFNSILVSVFELAEIRFYFGIYKESRTKDGAWGEKPEVAKLTKCYCSSSHNSLLLIEASLDHKVTFAIVKYEPFIKVITISLSTKA